MMFRIVEFEAGSHVTGVTLPGPRRVFGPMACSYVIRARSHSSCRLVVRLNVTAGQGLRRMASAVLSWGDLVMMRKQLLTIERLAEAGAKPSRHHLWYSP
jgi:hypothetical protein